MLPQQAAKTLIEWFWNVGRLRDETARVSLGGDLRNLYQISATLTGIHRSNQREKCAFGFWGPSQVGKSTLLASFIDAGVSREGLNSPLQWDPDEDLRFEIGDDPETSVKTLNPFNYKDDASACISRFTLATSVINPKFPVELQLADRIQLLHAVTEGFLSECNTRGPTGERKTLTAAIVEEEMGKYPQCGQPDRDSFEKLYELNQVLSVLCDSDHAGFRFASIDTVVQAQILEKMSGTAPEVVDKFIAWILWDGAPSLKRLFDDLCRTRENVMKVASTESRIFCSYDAAGLLLNMGVVRRALGGMESDGQVIVKDRGIVESLQKISYHVESGYLFIGMGLPNTLFREEREFALFQGLVWEMIISLREDRLKANAPTFFSLLEKADILDFPGVANLGTRGGDERISTDDLSNAKHDHKLFTNILKRGKTAAVVLAASSVTEIDGFCIMIRTQGPLAQPAQLTNGIARWWLQNTKQKMSDSRNRLMPVYLILSFFSELANDILRNPENPAIGGAFNKLGALGKLADPQLVKVFPIVLPAHERIEKTPGASPSKRDLATIKRTLVGHQFLMGLLETPQKIDAVLNDSGRELLIQDLLEQANSLRRGQRLSEMQKTQENLLKLFILEVCPGASAEETRRSERIEIVKKTIEDVMLGGEADSILQLSWSLRRVLEVDPESLTSIPLRMVTQRPDAVSFVTEQLEGWRDSRISDADVDILGLRDKQQMKLFLTHIIETVDVRSIGNWLKINFGHLPDGQAARHARRFLAIRLGDDIQGYSNGRMKQARGLISCHETLLQIDAYEQDPSKHSSEFNPHYQNVLLPFLRKLTQMERMTSSRRPEQPGDTELQSIIENCPLLRDSVGLEEDIIWN